MTKKQRGIYEKEPASNIWWIRYADVSGRIRREKGGTKGAAIKLYQKRKTEVLQGKKLPEQLRAKTVSFGELAQDALLYSKAHKLSYRQDVYRMKPLVEEFGPRIAESITPQDVERWLAQAADENDWEPSTINRFKALLQLAFRLGIENRKVTSNPAAIVRRRRENNGRVRYLSNEEEKRLRDAIQAQWPEHLPELEIALNTGMRRGEQYSLTWKDVDLGARLVTIRQSKNGDIRHIRLNPVALAALQALHAKSNADGCVFVNSRLERLQGPRHWFEPAIAAAGIKDFTWHCLRHTVASRLVMKGQSLRAVQLLLGHKTIQMTCRYAHLAPSHQLAVVDVLCETGGPPVEPTDTRTDTSLSARQ